MQYFLKVLLVDQILSKVLLAVYEAFHALKVLQFIGTLAEHR